MRALFALLLVLYAQGLYAADVSVAVASNFVATAHELAGSFEAETGYTVTLSPGSTGKHYAQIRHGAPFDVFLAADAERPELLCDEGLASPDTLYSYAFGRLVLWSKDLPVSDTAIANGLNDNSFRFLAIANPELAPYGRAAREYLEAGSLWGRLSGKLVRGENVAQAMQYVDSGNAQLALVAASLTLGQPGNVWPVPVELYAPIEQQAVLLKSSPAASAFMQFLQSEVARKIIVANGYYLP